MTGNREADGMRAWTGGVDWVEAAVSANRKVFDIAENARAFCQAVYG